VLNYGHTIGHAIEQASGFSVPHGLAVAEGMRFAARLAVQLYGATPDFVRRQDSLLDALGLQALDTSSYSLAELKETMQRDKKNQTGELTFVLVREPGVVGTAQIEPDILSAHMRPWLGIKSYEAPALRQRPDRSQASEEPLTGASVESFESSAEERSDKQPPSGDLVPEASTAETLMAEEGADE
jgi:hypothetical protein